MTEEPSVIYLYSLFKVLFPLITLAVAIVPPQLIPVFTRCKLLNERQVPALEYYALTDFINEGHLDAQIRRTQKIYQRRRQTLIFSLSTSFHDNVIISSKTAGLHLTVRFRPDWCSDKILSSAAEAEIPLVSTKPYYVDSAENNEFLIAFSNLPEETTPKKIQIFAERLGG
jgi:GntR family transcriptional regulator/MocR family aminotransferase